MTEDVLSPGGGGNGAAFASIEDELRTSYLAYSMSVIIGRALPDARDGLKPVHRRLLFTMHEMGNRPNQPYKKSARIVGEAMGKYHPHGDSALYDALVRMAQDFSMRYPLVDGQGNFGSVDGDPPAAMRYTEVRLHDMAEELLADLDKDTVEFQATYNDELMEPTVLPSRVPNLLLNGADGIAVGMATKIPPHNLGELTQALLHMIENPDFTLGDLINMVPGPDFPTAGFILGRAGIVEAYKTGRGTLTMRARVDIEVDKKDRSSIVVSELPYQVNKARLLTRIAELVRNKRLEGIADIRDESDREEGVRAVIILKRDANPQVVLNNLYKATELQQNYSMNMVAIYGGRPQLMNLEDLLRCFLEHRREVVSRRTAFELRQAEARAHVLEGLKIAVDNIDEVVQLIRASKDTQSARAGLMDRFELSEIQANAVLDMRLARLTGLERDKIVSELRDLYMTIERLKAILADEVLLMQVISDELRETAKEFGDPRRTEIIQMEEEIDDEDLIDEEDMAVTVTQAGYVKRTPISAYRVQGRGGKGVAGLATKAEDAVVDLFVASTHAHLLIITDRGRAFSKRVYELPKGSRTAKGKPIVNLIPLEKGERVQSFIPVPEFTEGRYIVMGTRDGLVKKTDLMAYSRIRRTGIQAIAMVEGDELISARVTDGADEILIGTAEGNSIRFNEEQIRPMGRVSRGVQGIKLRKKDRVVSMAPASAGRYVFTVCENGYGKRTELEEYTVQNRGGIGIITIKTSERNGNVVAMLAVDESNEIVMVTSSGKMIRFAVSEASVMGRNTQGVRLVSLDGDEVVIGVAKLVHDEDGDGTADDDGGNIGPSDGGDVGPSE